MNEEKKGGCVKKEKIIHIEIARKTCVTNQFYSYSIEYADVP